MSVLATADPTITVGPRLSRERLRGVFLWLLGCSGAFVFIEPGPYELVGFITIFVFAASGLSLRPALAPLVLLLLFLNIGYAVALLQIEGDQLKPVTWVLTSNFLVITAVFYAAMLTHNTQARLDWILRGTIAAAVIASLAAIGGYFHLFGGMSDVLLLYGRARGTFNDPNVLGAFLVLPALLLLQRILAEGSARALRAAVALMIVLAALFLSFSRAAFGQFVVCAFAATLLTFATTSSARQRLRILVTGIGAIALVVMLLVLLLSFGTIDALLQQRLAVEQSYDAGHFGRFGRYILGAQLGLEQPLGIGPLQFYRYFTEDPHNTFLNTFMSGGWLGGFSYLTLTLVTLTAGLRFIAVPTPWRPTYQVIYIAFVGTVVESGIIDIDHWRHYFLILGLLWGLMAATQAWTRERSQSPEPFLST